MRDCLTDYEQGEILDYKQIYHVGLKAKKIHGSLLQDNFGYDDENGNYIIIKDDHISYRY
jgi:dual specificity tyrosine-phosphorylation-regulated kinase 2/3/4